MSVAHSYVFGPGLRTHKAGEWGTCGENAGDKECTVFVRSVDEFGNWVQDNTDVTSESNVQLHCYGRDNLTKVGTEKCYTSSVTSTGGLRLTMTSPTALTSAVVLPDPSAAEPVYVGHGMYEVSYATPPRPDRGADGCKASKELDASCGYDALTDLSKTATYYLSVEQLAPGGTKAASYIQTFQDNWGGLNPHTYQPPLPVSVTRDAHTQARINVTWGAVDLSLCRASGLALQPAAQTNICA
jgi:hypothetical protein